MVKDFTLRVLPEVAASADALTRYIANEQGVDRKGIRAVRILKRSIDARQRTVVVNLTVRVFVGEEPPALGYEPLAYGDVSGAPAVVVVGAGPGGLFAALRLVELGLRPIVLERGKDVHSRRVDIARISREHLVDPESNYSFGEGGAGAYSDGKLFTRSKKRGDVDRILRIFCQHGADTTILADAHPHIGTDRLPRIIETMRETIRRCGGEVHFGTRVDGLLRSGNRVCGVRTADGREFQGPVILATGHSARDVYRWMYRDGMTLEPKGIAVGVRLEHPAHLIDCIQYHTPKGRGAYLPAAEYSVVTQVEGRGVYSFCMCPGGFVVPAASGPRQIVVNGMSPSTRGSKWSNAGLVVETHPDDVQEASLQRFMAEAMADEGFAAAHTDCSADHPLRLLYLQEALEWQCWVQGNRRQTAPAQRMADFVIRRLSYDLPASSYSPGLLSSPLHFWLPSFVTGRLADGFRKFGRSMRGFLTNDAALIAVETRTSAPVRMVRERETLHHVDAEGLFPCGEGAGYAGGIVSAAIDGERCANAVAAMLSSHG